MSLEPLLTAPWHIQLHAYAAIAAFVLGTVQVAAPKGTLPHRTLGLVWIVLMAIVAVTSVFIVHRLGPEDSFMAHFSWIHILTIVTIFALTAGTVRILRGGPRMKRHAKHFIPVYIGGLIIAGAFTFMPGRAMNAVMTGGEMEWSHYTPPYLYFLPGAAPPDEAAPSE